MANKTEKNNNKNKKSKTSKKYNDKKKGGGLFDFFSNIGTYLSGKSQAIKELEKEKEDCVKNVDLKIKNQKEIEKNKGNTTSINNPMREQETETETGTGQRQGQEQRQGQGYGQGQGQGQGGKSFKLLGGKSKKDKKNKKDKKH
jgi:hypothetical protein